MEAANHMAKRVQQRELEAQQVKNNSRQRTLSGAGGHNMVALKDQIGLQIVQGVVILCPLCVTVMSLCALSYILSIFSVVSE